MKANYALRSVVVIISLFLTSPPLNSVHSQNRDLSQEAGTNARIASGRYYALVIGIEKYQKIRKLKTAVDDAVAVEALLKNQYGFQTKLLTDANRQQIISALNAYRRELSPDAHLLIYYAGHGVNDEDANKAYWLPVDASIGDNSNWISADDITTSIRVIPAKHVLIVSDSCYSGTLTRDMEPGVSVPALRTRYLEKMLAGKSRTLMASGGNEPVLDGGGGGHSVFASALLRGLREMEQDQFTAVELFREFVEVSVAGRAEQTPEYNPLRNSGHERGDFVFTRVKTGGGTAKATVTPTVPLPTIDSAAVELRFWDAIKNSTDPEDYRDYVEKYPNGQFASIARRRANAPRTSDTGATVNPTRPVPITTAAPKRAVTTQSGIELVYIPAGTFQMGSTNGGADEKPVHEVTIRDGFYMGKYEVTQAQWQRVMGSNPSHFKGDNLPVEQVSWSEAREFMAKLNAQNDGYTYRLPTEAEWEYACRAGTTGDYAGDIDDLAWYDGNSNKTTRAVGTKQANGFGLHDMHGNVWEWCEDW